MASQPFDIDLIITRLKDEVPELQLVEGAAEYASITSLRDFRPKSAYVILVRERPDEEPPKRGRQRAIVSFGVVLADRNYRDVRGAELGNALNPLIGKVRDALIGFTPDAAGAREIKWMDGGVLDFDSNTLLWNDVYQTQHFIGA